jgi:hypothetical protein
MTSLVTGATEKTTGMTSVGSCVDEVRQGLGTGSRPYCRARDGGPAADFRGSHGGRALILKIAEIS